MKWRGSKLRGGLSVVVLVSVAVGLGACQTLSQSGSEGSGTGVFDQIMSADLSARRPNDSAQVFGPRGASEAGNSGRAGARNAAFSGVDVGGRSGNIQEAVFRGDGMDIVATAAAERPREGEVRLNFEDAALPAVVEAILGDALGLNYTLHPAVTGQVTLQSGRPIRQEHLLDVLEPVLAMHGAMLMKEGEHYHVVPETSITHARADGLNTRPGYGVSVIPLRYVSAEALGPVLEGFGIKPGAANVDTQRNLLLVTGNSRERRTAVETVLSFDQDWMQDQSVAIVPTRQAPPQAIIPELERIFQAREDQRGQGTIQFIPMARAKAILVVSGQRDLIERSRNWIQRLDLRDGDLDTGVQVYRARYRDAEKLVEILEEIFRDSRDDAEGGEGVGMSVAGGMDMQGGPTGQRLGQSQRRVIQFSADMSNNSVVIAANRPDREQIVSALRQIDVPPLQVAIHVTMAEVRLNDELRHGVQYFLKHNEDRGSVGLFNTVVNQISRELPGFNFLYGAEENPDIIIDAFDRITDVQILSSPSIVVMENERAGLQVGDQVPVAVRQAESVDDSDARIVNQIEFRDTGIILNVTPRVADNGVVSLDIEQEVSSVVGGGGTLTPTISRRSVNSKISIMDGQTVLLGGLISENNDDTRAGIPGLHRVNLIGNLFGRTTRLGTRTELIMLIRPSVIRDGDDAQRVAEDLRARLSAGRGVTGVR